jgi:acyl dehydratase
MVEIPDIGALRDQIGQEVAVSEWYEVTQDHIDLFANATSDHQWIHIDPPRAVVESPFRTTIAHGFLTLSLLSVLMRQALHFGGLRMAVNYGLDRVRFTAPVPAGSRVRGRFVPTVVEDTGGNIQITWTVTMELENGDRPCCVAEWIVRYYRAET